MSNWIEDIRSAVSRLTSTRAGYLDNLNRTITRMPFWSLPQATLTVGAVATQTLPSVAVSGLPSGCTIVRVIPAFKFWKVADTSAGANKLSGDQEIQVRDDTPSAWIDAINFTDDCYSLAASGEGGGDVVFGIIDVKATCDGDDTYEFQWDSATADAASLVFSVVQTGLIFEIR